MSVYNLRIPLEGFVQTIEEYITAVYQRLVESQFIACHRAWRGRFYFIRKNGRHKVI